MNRLRFIILNPFSFLVLRLLRIIPFFKFLFQTSTYQNRVDWKFWFKQKILNHGRNKEAYWPVHPTSQVYEVQNILIGIDAYPGVMKGCYIQGKGGILIGDYTQIAPNVAIVSANHDMYDSRKHIEAKVVIGKYCWLGFGCKIMPWVTLGDFTIVGAGAVVTKSFTLGYCIIGGVPAIKIKDLEKNKCVKYVLEPKFYGYISAKKFDKYRRQFLNV